MKEGPASASNAWPSNHLCGLLGREPDRPCQLEGGQKLRGRHADPRALRSRGVLGAAHVGAPPKQIRRHPHRDAHRHLRQDSRTSQELCELLRRHAEEYAQGIDGLAPQALELGNRGFGVVKERRRLLHVELGGATGFIAHPRNAKAVLLHPHVVPRHREPLIQRPDGEVGGGDLGNQAHEDIVIARHRGQEVRVRRLYGPAELSPKVDLPGGVEARQKGVKSPGSAEGAEEGVFALQCVGIGADQGLLLREEGSDRDGAARLGFDDPKARRAER